MEIPIYYTFSEFISEYDKNLKDWLKIYSEADEISFAKEYKKRYDYYLRYNYDKDKNYRLNGIVVNNHTHAGGLEISISEYAEILNHRLSKYFEHEHKEIIYKNIEVIIDEIHDFNFSTIEIEWDDEYLIEKNIFEKYKDFFIIEEFLGEFLITVDEVKFKNFGFAIEKIINYLTSIITSQKEGNKKVLPIINGKIISKMTNIQAIGYLFTELINKGLIEPKRKNGNISPLNISRMILEHFYFEDLEEQPNEEGLRKALFNDNRLSSDKISLFKLPSIKQLNQ